ncbi:MAG: ABC transporter ATP-binding protein [Myxococcota bacterium]
MTAMLSAQNLSLRLGRFTLSVPSWEVPPGAVVGLVGPNGAGKSTLLELVIGLRKPDAGELRVHGADPWTDAQTVRLGTGYMTDDLELWNLRIDKLLRRVSAYYATWDAALVEQLMERFGLDPRARPYALSKGQATRLRLVLAMAHRPRLLLLDEPATGLDVAGRRGLLQSVLEVVRDPECSVVVSSHQLVDLERVVDHLLVLHEGRVVQQGPIDRLVGDERSLEEAMVTWGAV